MKLSEFKIGLEFCCGSVSNRYRVTDLGSRVVVAIRLDQKDVRNYNGPPYSIEEIVLDENDYPVCFLEHQAADYIDPEGALAWDEYTKQPQHINSKDVESLFKLVSEDPGND